MQIGVDAAVLSAKDERLKLGVYTVVLHLLAELAKLDKRNSYRLYTYSPLTKDILSKLSPIMKNSVLAPNIGWFTLRLPMELLVKPVDVYLGVSQAVPRFALSFNIGFIYDLAFIHIPEAYSDANRLMKLTGQLIDRSEHIVTISNSTKEDILKNFKIPENKISVAYLGVDDIFSQYGVKFIGSHPYFLFVGALKIGKNIPAIIEAFSRFLKGSSKVYDLLLVGSDYWLDGEINKTINKLQITNRVKILGTVATRDLPAYYRGATSFVSPSLWEGFCIPVAEAMSCGCPVIVSDRGALPEVVDNAGLIVNPKSIEDIAGAMRLIAGDIFKRTQLVQMGLARAKIFSWSNFTKSVLSVINKYEHKTIR